MRTGSPRFWLPAALLLGALALLLCPSSAAAQVACGNTAAPCAGGLCPDLYEAGNPTAVATAIACVQPAGERCACVYMKVDAACTIRGNKCQGKCPGPYYRSVNDAQNGKNPVRGVCQRIAGAAAGAQCQCVWKFR